MTDQKTLPTALDVKEYIQAIPDPIRREDCQKLAELMSEITGKPGVLWGPSIIGFDQYHYRYASGREGTSLRIGFAHRAGDISLYNVTGFDDAESYLTRLGKHKMGKGCLYVKRLADIDLEILKEMIRKGYQENKDIYPAD
jgi:hypothetical protein